MSTATKAAIVRPRPDRRGDRSLRPRVAAITIVVAAIVAGVLIVEDDDSALVVGGLTLFALLTLVVAGRRSASREVAIVGDLAFANWATEAAERAGREVRIVIDPDDGLVGELPMVDEILVDRRLYDDIDDIAPGGRLRGRLLFAEFDDDATDSARRARDDITETNAQRARFVNPFDRALRPAARVFKRAVDTVVLVIATPFVVCLVPFIALAVKIGSRGPVIFSQERVGADGQLFRLYKFRTMYVDNDDSVHREYVAKLMREEAPQHKGIYKLANDPRVTPVGRFLRRYSLDEIPQLWNVLIGDMCIVGPRPPLLSEARDYNAHAWNRLRVPPGMTGLWQVSGRCALSFKEMVELDIDYWRKWSPSLELSILARTPVALVSTKGAA